MGVNRELDTIQSSCKGSNLILKRSKSKDPFGSFALISHFLVSFSECGSRPSLLAYDSEDTILQLNSPRISDNVQYRQRLIEGSNFTWSTLDSIAVICPGSNCLSFCIFILMYDQDSNSNRQLLVVFLDTFITRFRYSSKKDVVTSLTNIG